MNPLLKTDAYKLFHREMYPDNTTLVYSNWTPRSNRHYTGNNEDGVVVFGIQATIKKLIEEFDAYFFGAPRERVVKEYKRVIGDFTGNQEYETGHIDYLHSLGKLPLVIKALPEGTMCPIGVPCLTVYNTDPRCFWLVNYLETLLSAELWPHMTNATISREYRQILQEYGELTGVPDDFIQWQGHDFSMRGLYGSDVGRFGMGHLLSFTGTDTIPVFAAVNKFYPMNGLIASSVPASEHSVQCAHYTGDGDEDTYMRHMLDLHPTGIVSIVCDGFDYWNFVTKVLPKFKDEIMARDGRVVIRPDTGSIVDIICGLNIFPEEQEWDENTADQLADDLAKQGYNGANFKGHKTHEIFNHPDVGHVFGYSDMQESYEQKGSIETLWDIFGGTEVKGTDGKMYKHLDPHIGLIYGDSVTIPICREVCEKLAAKGFSTNNLVFGIGSYTFQYNTRDTFGFAMKATYIEQKLVDVASLRLGNTEKQASWIRGKEIFKDPKTKGNMSKKSLKGLITVAVNIDDNGQPHLVALDQQDWDRETTGYLREVFRDGKLLINESLEVIRERVRQNL